MGGVVGVEGRAPKAGARYLVFEKESRDSQDEASVAIRAVHFGPKPTLS
jgi:hypothetical protein